MEKMREQFNSLAHDVLTELNTHDNYPSYLKSNMGKLLVHIVPNHVDAYRSFLIPKAFQLIKPNSPKQEVLLAEKLGWCYQLYQAFGFMISDFVDRAEIRHCAPTWLKLNDNSPHIVVGDMLLVESATYFLLRKHFENLGPKYLQLFHLFQDCGYSHRKGHRLDAYLMVQNYRKGILPKDTYTKEAYQRMAEQKNSPVQFYMPIALAMILAGYDTNVDHKLFKKVDTVCKRFGILSQGITDFYDVGNGRDGLDFIIKQGRFHWLFLVGKENCNTVDEWKMLYENYGREDKGSVEIVKKMYEHVNIPEEFDKIREEETKTITELIEETFDKEDNPGIVNFLKWYLDYMLAAFVH